MVLAVAEVITAALLRQAQMLISAAVVVVDAAVVRVAAVEPAFLAAMDQPERLAVLIVQQAVFLVAVVAAAIQPLGPAVMAKLKCLSGNYELRNH